MSGDLSTTRIEVEAETTVQRVDAAQLATLAKDLYVDGPIIRRKFQHWRPYICPFQSLMVHIPDGARVLDIGCGGGLLMNLMVGLGMKFNGVGIDLSRPAIDLAQKAARRALMKNSGATLSFRQIEAGEDWPAGQFDVLTCIDLLHHIPATHQRGYVHRLATASKAKKLIFKDMSPVPFWMGLANLFHDLLISHQWITMRHEEQVCEWLMEDGLEVKECSRIDTLWYSHYLIVAEKGNR